MKARRAITGKRAGSSEHRRADPRTPARAGRIRRRYCASASASGSRPRGSTMNRQPRGERANSAPSGGAGARTTGPGVDVRDLVHEADLGRRKPVGIAARILAVTCIGWSLLQLWYASPLPFTFNVFILNDTE